MRIRSKLSLAGQKNETVEVVAYFHHAGDGEPLRDQDSRYRTGNGYVSTGQKIQPQYDVTNWNDFSLFIPYTQLDVDRGLHELEFDVVVYRRNGDRVVKLAESTGHPFRYKRL